MLYKFRRTFVMLCKLFTFFLSIGIFIGFFSVRNPHLLRMSRTSAIVLLAFTAVYVMTTQIYGGLAIGEKKSKPIIYSLSLCIVTSNLIAHLFLCIMNVTVINDGHFVYEQPMVLLFSIFVQITVTAVLTYVCNHLYFTFVSPQNCLIITHSGEDIRALRSNISSYRKQYRICNIVDLYQPNLLSLIDKHDSIFLCNLTSAERVNIVEYCYSKRKSIYYTLEIADFVSLGAKRVMFGDTSMMYSAPKGLTIEQRILKRGFDIIVSLLCLILLSPVFLVTAIAIKLEDGGSVFYCQKRATYAGRTFSVIKFRSMKENNSVNVSVTKDDDRITKVGHFIRKFRIDELPQLINVLKSDMSLVGPRPEMLENVEKYTHDLPEFSYRLWAKAGITGMAQIFGKYNTSPKEKLALDLAYIEQYSLLLDLRLLLRTVLVFFTPNESTEAFDTEEEELSL